jgi:hypothetical protein
MMVATDKLQLTGQNLYQVFNFRIGCIHAVHLLCYGIKRPNFKLKTQLKELLGSLLLDIALPTVANAALALDHRDKTRVQMPAKIFPQLKVKC